VTAEAIGGSVVFDAPEPFDLTPDSEIGFVMIGTATSR
jgi:hypothetical protein